MAVDLGAGLDGDARTQFVQKAFKDVRRQILEIVIVDLDHRCVGAGAQTFHRFPGKVTVRREVMRVMMDDALAHFFQGIGAKTPVRWQV